MGFFKEIKCSVCGKKTNLLSRMKLKDGSYLCGDCVSKIPPHMRDSVRKNYDLEEYNALLDYIQYSNETLRPVFHGTHSYYSIHIDTENKLFYFGYGIDANTVFFHFKNLEDFNLVFHAEEYKEGLLGDKVKGELLMTIKVQYPYFYYEEILDHSAKAKAKKKLLSSSVEYDNPTGMDEFLLYFTTAWRTSREEAHAQSQYNECTSETAAPGELQQAMALFMLDSLESVTLDDIKVQRNRLIKAFHPDKGSAADTAYAQKINNAYEVLKKHLS